MTVEPTHLLDGRVVLEQPREGFRVSIDAVLAAAATPASPGERVLDAGAGTGAIALCLAKRVPGLIIDAIEANATQAHHARNNIAMNDLGATIALHQASLFDCPQALRIEFDHVVSNPPYHHSGRHRLPNDPTKAMAGHLEVTTGQWIEACIKRVGSNGWLTLIHKAETLGEILHAIDGPLGDIEVIPIWPRDDAPCAKRVVVRGRKGRRGPLKLCRGLTLHVSGHSYTQAADAILRHAQPLAATTG